MISRSIVQGIRDQNGRFLEQDPKTAVWYEISDRRAIEKTSHALSNKKYKTRKRLPESQATQIPVSPRAVEPLQSQDDNRGPTEVVSPSSPTEDQGKSKLRTKKHRLLQRMEKPATGLTGENEMAGKNVSPSSSPEVPGSPVSEVSSATGKSALPDSPPYETRQLPPGRFHLEEPPVVSPNDSRASPSSERSYEEEHHAPPPPHSSSYGRYYHDGDKLTPPGLRRYSSHGVPEAEVYTRADPRYEGYHPEDRHCREGMPYTPPGMRPREHHYPRYVEREWHPTRESMDYSSWRARSSPYYGLVSPRAVKGSVRGPGPSGWVEVGEWEVPSQRRHPDAVQPW